MLFNSLEFLVFLLLLFGIYWAVPSKNNESRNVILLLASWLFYGWWDWRFLFLIIGSSILDFYVGKKISKESTRARRKALLLISICCNLGVLAFFKYFNFFLESLNDILYLFDENSGYSTLKILLPVGISFYTFQTLSYTIDIYRGRINAESSLIKFMTFVSFFPQLVAGPIERASHLLPQFSLNKVFKYETGVLGLRYILWGFFMKSVLADNVAGSVNDIFQNYNSLPGGVLLLGALLFAFQIYGDFAGYSYIAIGVAKLFGFDLMINFRYPYLSSSISEFWRRWHISLSSWFRDYVFIPLGGSRVGALLKFRNLFITFVVSGMWHGANWTFIIWGGLHWIYYIVFDFLEMIETRFIKVVKGSQLFTFLNWGLTFFLVVIAWVFFRAESFNQAIQYLHNTTNQNFVNYDGVNLFKFILGLKFQVFICLIILVLEFIQKEKSFVMDLTNLKKAGRYSVYFIVALGVIFLGKFSNLEFIYFQF